MRTVNRLLSLLLGLALLLGGALAVANGTLTLADQPPRPSRFDRPYAWLTGTQLGDPVVLWTAVAVTVLGVVLLVAQLRPWPPTRLAIEPVAVQDGAGPDSWWLRRRPVERHLADAVNDITGISSAAARLRGRGTRWRLTVTATGRRDTRSAIEQTVRSELQRLCAPTGTRLKVKVRKPRRVS